MAQLVKLLDYVSRYEKDLSRYPTQYVRLKRYQWDRMKTQWENGKDLSEWQEKFPEEVPVDEDDKWFSPIFRLFGKRSNESEEELEEVVPIKDENTESDASFDFAPNLNYTPKNITELRRQYLDQLFHFQIKWASSTLMDKSKVNPMYMRDTLLRSFAQLLPDNYLLFYYPILKVKKAPVELDILLITPVECMCITVLEEENLAAFVDTGDRFWAKKIGDKETKFLNPMIGLNRMEKIVSGILKTSSIDFPVKKYLISRNGYIDRPGGAFEAEIIDRRTYDKWFDSLKKTGLPMKSTQFKAAQTILDLGQTTAMSTLFDTEENPEEID